MKRSHTVCGPDRTETVMWFAVGHLIGAVIGGFVLVVGAILDEARP